jgi:hypothetical protein
MSAEKMKEKPVPASKLLAEVIKMPVKEGEAEKAGQLVSTS